MNRPAAFVWLPLLVVLFGGSSLTKSPERAWSHVGNFQSTQADGTLEGHYVRATAAWHQALDARTRKNHPPVARAGLLPVASATPTFVGQQLAGLRHWAADIIPRQACHYPLFPTGPPSHT
jgi:hypothetical protein